MGWILQLIWRRTDVTFTPLLLDCTSIAGHSLATGPVRSDAALVNEPGGQIACQFHAREAEAMDMKLEVVVVPVADVDRAKNFYRALGWREDADYAAGADFRVVQLTPPGSACSIIFGTRVTSAAPGSAQGLHLVVTDIEVARAELAACGAEMSEVFHDAGGFSTTVGQRDG
jgi:catechol 2,3-dioxygenase-like lactoylglutathione lyase family enzyme